MRTALLLLLFVTAAAAQPHFSHQAHLARGVSCVDCHGSAVVSSEATDRNLPTEAVCLSCHDGNAAPGVETAWLAERPLDFRTYRFNHEFHLRMGNAAPIIAAAIDSGTYLGPPGDLRPHLDTGDPCQACHRGLSGTDLASKENLPRMADCLVCHNKVENPFSCSECHLPEVNLRPANHTRDFVDAHSTGRLGLDKQTCLPCHGRNFACMGCH